MKKFKFFQKPEPIVRESGGLIRLRETINEISSSLNLEAEMIVYPPIIDLSFTDLYPQIHRLSFDVDLARGIIFGIDPATDNENNILGH
jgi:hypothetical protein